MSLYDDLDHTLRQKSDEVAGWSSGIKLFQSQLQAKKAASSTKRDGSKKSSVLAPVFDLNTKREDEDNEDNKEGFYAAYGDDLDWNFTGAEYDPVWPNDYEKVVKDLRELREKEREKEDEERIKKREERERRTNRVIQLDSNYIPVSKLPHGDTRANSVLQSRRFLQVRGVKHEKNVKKDPTVFRNDPSMEEPKPLMSVDLSEPDEDGGPPTKQGRGGVAIAPPPSLVEQIVPKAYGASVAAKIMAKYGFKEGQGLGKKEQGISMALQVEKTSKRGGRIVHEKDMMPPPPPSGLGSSMAPPPTPSSPPRPSSPPKPKPITEIMKTPSKVVLLKNMVGPGEVDEELEPEVKDECNTKYGDVVRVIIYELPNVTPEEAVRIFVEFKRIESAIKAVVDLNGRFFGGRQVMAGFYPWEKLENLELLD